MGKLYIKLMTTNIKNGKRFYFPYILAGAVIVVLFYNMMAIYYNDGLSNMTGGQDIKMIMQFGTVGYWYLQYSWYGKKTYCNGNFY